MSRFVVGCRLVAHHAIALPGAHARGSRLVKLNAGDPSLVLARLVTEMSGGVHFKVDGTEVSAHEASLDLQAGEIRLRGDVRLRIR